MPLSLLDLPFELVVEVLEVVETRDLLQCQSVCKLLQTAIHESPFLQYRIELWTAGLIENFPRIWSIPDRMSRLRRHLDGWKHLQPSRREEIPLSINSGTLYELYGNIFARGTATPWLGRPRPTNGICFVELPSPTSDLPSRKWSREDLGMKVADFTMDPVQDLLVLIERQPHGHAEARFSVHLRSLTTNEAHPLARIPELIYTTDVFQSGINTHTFTSYIMQVCGDMLGVLFLHEYSDPAHGHLSVQELIIWNWKTGVERAEITPEAMQDEQAHSFSFLARDVVLLAKATDEEGLLDICMLYDADADEGRAERIATFHLPKAKARWCYQSVLSRSDPSPVVRKPSEEPPSAPTQGMSRDPLFVFDPAARLFVFTITLQDYEIGVERRVVLFTHLSTLLEPVQEFLANRASGIPARTRYRRVIPWMNWAEKTRMLHDRHIASHVCYIAGYRYITADRVPGNTLEGEASHGGSCIRVLDFSPLQIRKELTQRGRASVEAAPLGIVRRIVTKPTSAPDLFSSKVVTRLPYAEVTAGVAILDATGFLLDSERIIVMKKTRGRERLDVLSF